jgi:hypothetical protein
MEELRRAAPQWRLLSLDDGFLGPGRALLKALRRHLVEEVVPAPEGTYSSDFVMAMMQTAVIYLRDRLLELPAGPPILVDSYYYKVLAKCRLAGARDNPMFRWWRSFPQPRGVVFLDVAPDVAWRRSGCGVTLNRMEHFDDRPSQEGFVAYQRELGRLLLEEVGDLRTSFVDAHGDPVGTTVAVRKAVENLED